MVEKHGIDPAGLKPPVKMPPPLSKEQQAKVDKVDPKVLAEMAERLGM